MANTILTISQITREAIRLWKNSNAFLMNIDTQYDDAFARTGAKIGTALRIRLPNDYTVRSGATATPQDTTEKNTTLTLATQKGVDVSFSSVERTMQLDDYSKRVLRPAVNNLAGAVAADIMSGAEGGVSNMAGNITSQVVSTPTATTYLTAGAVLSTYSSPMNDRKIVNSQFTEARVIAGLAGLFNPAPAISKQYETGIMKSALGFEWMMDQTTLVHVSGTFTAGTINGASQSGLTMTTNATTGTLKVGDIVTIDGVNSVNRITKQDTGQLAQFVLTAAALTAATSLSLYPAVIGPSGGNPVAYQTVASLPADAAAIRLVATGTYRKNFAFVPEAITMATADLELPRGVHEAARQSYDGISIRMITAYAVLTDAFITRMDILYGYLFVRPEWAVVIPDVVP